MYLYNSKCISCLYISLWLQIENELDDIFGSGPVGAIVVETEIDELINGSLVVNGLVIIEEGFLVEYFMNNLIAGDIFVDYVLLDNFIDEQAESPNVALGGDGGGGELFGGSVSLAESHGGGLLGFVLEIQRFAQSQICQFHLLEVRIDQHVLQFQIAMHEVHLVQLVHSSSHFQYYFVLVFQTQRNRLLLFRTLSEYQRFQIHLHLLHHQCELHLLLRLQSLTLHSPHLHQMFRLAQQIAHYLVQKLLSLIYIHFTNLHSHLLTKVSTIVHTSESSLS